MSKAMQPNQDSCDSDWHLVNVKTHAVMEDGACIDVTLIKVSTEGCVMRSSAGLQPGMLMSLSLLKHGSIDAHVRTISEGQAELAFDVNPALVRSQAVRQSDRVPVSGEALLRRPLRNSYQVRIFDISYHGCRLEFIDRPEVNEQVYVGFPGLGNLPAEVRWIGNTWVGVSFLTPLHPAVFDTLVVKLQSRNIAGS